ncbi:hypothetical protein J3B02_002344, partial [Coemansia erecta]
MASAGSAANAEAAAKFWSNFQHQKQQIKQMASRNQDISQRLRNLDTSLREALIYLPPYDQKQLTRDLDELRALLHKTSVDSSLMVSNGKSKAGFRFKSAVTRPAEPLMPPPAAAIPEANTRDCVADTKDTSYSFAGITGAWVIAELHGTSQTDCELRDITDSIIDLRPISHSLRALNCHRLQNTLVICGPFAGSATVRDTKHSTLILGVRQFRLENSNTVDVFVYCTSHPIIENSSAVRFAPLPTSLVSEMVLGELEKSGLGGLENCFDKVDDFNWLKRMASPNWSLLNTQVDCRTGKDA